MARSFTLPSGSDTGSGAVAALPADGLSPVQGDGGATLPSTAPGAPGSVSPILADAGVMPLAVVKPARPATRRGARLPEELLEEATADLAPPVQTTEQGQAEEPAATAPTTPSPPAEEAAGAGGGSQTALLIGGGLLGAGLIAAAAGGGGGGGSATPAPAPPQSNQVPVAVADSYTTAEDVVLTVAAAGVLANDSDPDGNPLNAVLVTGPTKGTLALNANGSFTYTPNANANGEIGRAHV